MSLIYKGQTIADVGGGSGGGGGVPKGTIVIWSGAADAIPSGWALCDGTNGTPNLSGHFVFGAGNDIPAGSEAPFGASGTKYLYYTLCYIIKITDGGSGSSEGSSEEIYSTEETRIGTWIDGKPLYRKTYSVSKDYPNAGSDLDVPIAEDIFGSISSVVNVYGAGYARGVIVCVNASNFVISGSVINTYCFVQGEPMNSRFLLRYRGGNSGTFKADVTLEYTKTTDEAAS